MKLKDAMRNVMLEKNISQTELAKQIGKSKASVSQYLSGKQVPSDETMKQIAEVLGLDESIFLPKKKEYTPKIEAIPRLDVYRVAELLGMNHVTVRKGLQQGVFPWGYAIQTKPNRWVYFINAKKFAEIEEVVIA